MLSCKGKDVQEMTEIQARSSVGERYLDAVEVGGSIPPVPTILPSILMKF